MLGLAFLFVFLIYLLISIGVIAYTVRKAKERGIAGWKWGVPAALFMYLIVFWDHIPTLIAHEYYCDKEAGFKVYKTLEQWKEENPGVAETLTYEDKVSSQTEGNKTIYYMNERFDSVTTRTPVFLSVKERKYQIIDKLKNDVLAEYIDYSSGGGFQNAKTLTDYKLWLANASCEAVLKTDTLFFEFVDKAKKIGDDKL
jgi:HSP90 family molecular chaperone